MTIPPHSDLDLLQQLIRRDRLRKFVALLLLGGITGGALYAQAPWVLALLTSGLAGGTAWHRYQSQRNQPLPPRTTGP